MGPATPAPKYPGHTYSVPGLELRRLIAAGNPGSQVSGTYIIRTRTRTARVREGSAAGNWEPTKVEQFVVLGERMVQVSPG